MFRTLTAALAAALMIFTVVLVSATEVAAVRSNIFGLELVVPGDRWTVVESSEHTDYGGWYRAKLQDGDDVESQKARILVIAARVQDGFTSIDDWMERQALVNWLKGYYPEDYPNLDLEIAKVIRSSVKGRVKIASGEEAVTRTFNLVINSHRRQVIAWWWASKDGRGWYYTIVYNVGVHDGLADEMQIIANGLRLTSSPLASLE